MSVNRFDFLELGEEGASVPPAEPFDPDAPLPPQREIRAEVLHDGTMLAQVRFEDARGYFTPDMDVEEENTLANPGRTPERPETLRVVEVLGARGAQTGQFNYPTGLAVDSGGVLFVADSYNHRVQRITPDGGVATIGSRGQGRGQFLSPQGVAVDKQQAFYIVEQGNHRVQKYSSQGVLLLIFGRPGRGLGELHGPTGIAVAPGSGDIFVADTGNSRIQRFGADGYFLGTVGAGQYPALVSPQALVVDGNDNLYAADTFAQRVVRYDPPGRLDYQWGGQNAGTAFVQPRGLALDRSGLLYVSDGTEMDVLGSGPRGRVQCINLREHQVSATLESLGRGLGALLRPGGLAVAPAQSLPELSSQDRLARGDLYVADTMNHRILRFSWS